MDQEDKVFYLNIFKLFFYTMCLNIGLCKKDVTTSTTFKFERIIDLLLKNCLCHMHALRNRHIIFFNDKLTWTCTGYFYRDMLVKT